MVIQAAWEKTPLLQLPHFNEETLRMCTSKRVSGWCYRSLLERSKGGLVKHSGGQTSSEFAM